MAVVKSSRSVDLTYRASLSRHEPRYGWCESQIAQYTIWLGLPMNYLNRREATWLFDRYAHHWISVGCSTSPSLQCHLFESQSAWGAPWGPQVPLSLLWSASETRHQRPPALYWIAEDRTTQSGTGQVISKPAYGTTLWQSFVDIPGKSTQALSSALTSEPTFLQPFEPNMSDQRPVWHSS